jgi:adenine-specific DNA-methyltransferase
MATILAQAATGQCIEADARDRGAVFTPNFLARWVAGLVRESCDTRTPVIADFGCGSGNLLSAAADLYPSSNLVGVEIDGPSVGAACEILGASAKLIVDDFLSPTFAEIPDLAGCWIKRLGGRPDALIMNPPWGAVHNLSKQIALSSGLTLAHGQFDTYDLFCQLALQILRPGGSFVFIVPDSIFLPEHEELRRLLAAKTTISLIARLGEGIFHGVYRGCAIVAGRRVAPDENHQVECIRLTKKHRDSLLRGRTLSNCRDEAAHFVPQQRFRNDPCNRFDIDVTSSDETITRVMAAAGNWIAPLNSRRGVELSKSGRVVLCDLCGAARPQPKADAARCLDCGGALSDNIHIIVADEPSDQGCWSPFIAGEDVRRYSAESHRWIRTDLPGINYKAPHIGGSPRILIRKTGVGLNAALDLSDAFTNQVVFEYTLADRISFDFSYLHYALGVLCSRVLLAVHLKRGGDLEWRSHPYVTQRTLAELPIPLPRPHTREWHQAAAIAGAVQLHLAGQLSELHVEGLVGGLYGLCADDMRWVGEVLSNAGNLQAITALRLPVDQLIEPVTVQ